MLKETITYENFDGETVTETFYFNLTKAELLEIEMQTSEGSLSDTVKKLGRTKNGGQIIELFKLILSKAYGIRTEEGGFKKNKELFDEFATTEAYSELFMGIVTDVDKMSNFIAGLVQGAAKGVTPEQVREQIEKKLAEQGETNVFKEAPSAPPAQEERTDGPRPPRQPVRRDDEQPPLFNV